MSDFGTKWRAALQELLDQRKLRERPLLLQPGEVESVLDGMEMITAKKTSGKELIYTMSAQ